MRTTLIPDITKLKKMPLGYQLEVVRVVTARYGREGAKLAAKLIAARVGPWTEEVVKDVIEMQIYIPGNGFKELFTKSNGVTHIADTFDIKRRWWEPDYFFRKRAMKYFKNLVRTP